MNLLFPFAEYWWFYLFFTGFVLLLLALDLGVFHRQAHVVTFRESVAWSVVWVALALVFNFGFYRYAVAEHGAAAGGQLGLEFLTGYLVEKSLAVDNIFVFVLVFAYFGVPPKMLFASDTTVDPEKNAIVRLFRRMMPVTPELHGQRFFVRVAGRLHATPLLVALLFLEMSDIIFAVDSVPAIFALTREPLIVFTSNVFAILGLRAMYFLLADAIQRFHLLKYALAFVLIFVGLKMVWLNAAFGGKFPITWSLGIIAALLAGGIAGSLLRKPRRDEPPVPASDAAA
jgi:tellurite resistance protein TerC